MSTHLEVHNEPILAKAGDAHYVTTWFLAYQGADLALPQWPAHVMLMEAEIPSPELNQFLFTAVGTPWHWFSRLAWDYQQWLDFLTNEQLRTFVLYVKGTPAGYVELWCHPDDDHSVELKFFGLMPSFAGKGLGKSLAQAAIALAQQWQPGKKVWVHTCSDDHPAALATYQKAGFVIEFSEIDQEDVPENYAELALCAPYVQSRLARFSKR